MDTPQSESNSQNIFQVEEVNENQPQAQSVEPPPQEVGQGQELSPQFPPPQEPTFEDSPGGNPLFRILMILIVIVLIAIVGYFGYRFFASRGGGTSGPITLNYWGLWEDESIMQPIIDEYQKNNPNVTIKYTYQTPKQYRERLEAAIQRGGEVDMFRFHNTWTPMLKDKLSTLPESVLSKKDYEATFYPVTKTDLTVSGNYVGIPLMIDGLGLYVNKDILQAAGVADPKTWDDVQIAADTLKVIPPDGKIRTGGIALGTANNVEHFSDILALMMMQNGATVSNPTTPEATDALAYYRLYAEDPSRVWDESMPNSVLAFAQGQVAMIFAPSWQAFAVKAINPDLNFKVIPVPQLKDAPPVTWASYWVEGVANNSQNQKAAWEFLKYLSSKDIMTKLYTAQAASRGFGEPYSRTDLAQTLTSDPIVGAYILQAPQAKSFPLASRTHDNGINDRMIKYLEDAVNSVANGASPQSALETAAAGFKQVLSQYGLAQGAATTSVSPVQVQN